VATALLFVVEIQLGLKVLTLSPVIALISGMAFFVKAGILTGAFYLQAAVLFATAFVMCLLPDYGISLFGVVAAGCFFFPGLKYYRQREERRKTEE
jgi:serine/threonine-protein kinase